MSRPSRIVQFQIGPDNSIWQNSLVVLDDEGRVWIEGGPDEWHLLAGTPAPAPAQEGAS